MVLLPLQVYGWWDTGHMLVAQIAYKHLYQDNATSPEVLSSLENAVNSLVVYANNSNTFVTAACWMDDIKNRDFNQMDNWHYINLPYCYGFNETETNSTEACWGISVAEVLANSYSGDFEDALWAINQGIATIKSKYAQGFERGLAMRNLLHIVGDIHQPLHATTMYTPLLPGGDLGGNLFYLNLSTPGYGKLHGFWDSGVGQLNNNILRPLNASAAAYLSDTADQIMAYSANITANANWNNVTEWGMESYYLAIQYCYNISNNSIPSPEYIEKGWDIVQQRIGLAGYRLAQILKYNVVTCSSGLNNCPVEAAPADDKWTIVAIVLAVILGGSVLANIVLTYSVCRRRSRDYERTPLKG